MSDKLQQNVTKIFASIGDLALDSRENSQSELKSTAASIFRGIGDGIDKMPSAFPWIKFLIILFDFLGKLAELLESIGKKDPP